MVKFQLFFYLLSFVVPGFLWKAESVLIMQTDFYTKIFIDTLDYILQDSFI